MNKYILIICFIVLALGISGLIVAEESGNGVTLSDGKNIINMSANFSPIYVGDLVKLYPEITTVTYNDGKQEMGYVNALGGVGDNFTVYPNNVYEITVTGEVTLNLK